MSSWVKESEGAAEEGGMVEEGTEAYGCIGGQRRDNTGIVGWRGSVEGVHGHSDSFMK